MIPDQDDRQAADELQHERYQLSVAAIWHAAMLGLPDDELRHLARETGIEWVDVQCYTQPVLREVTTEQLPFEEPPF